MLEVGDRFYTCPRGRMDFIGGGVIIQNNVIQKMVTSDCSKMQDSADLHFWHYLFLLPLLPSWGGGGFDQNGTFEKPSVCQGCTKVPGTRQLKTEIDPCLQF